ncbi:MAG: ester cyclase [Bacteroidales bacterium]|nr:ester cyclase [Bacteroidales bacterium]
MKKYLFALIAFSFLAGACCQDKIDNEKERIAMADKYVKAWNEGNLSLFDEVLSTECVRHHVDFSEDLIGIEAIKEYVTSIWTGFPDFNVTVDELIIAEDHTIARWTVTGTNTGPSGDSPPTGKKVKYSGVEVARVVDGKTIETWIYTNRAALLTQLGYIITPPEQ